MMEYWKVFLFIIIIGLIGADLIHGCQEIEKQQYSQAFKTKQEHDEFKRKLHYHGLDKRFSVVFTDWNGNKWFERNGQKIKF